MVAKRSSVREAAIELDLKIASDCRYTCATDLAKAHQTTREGVRYGQVLIAGSGLAEQIEILDHWVLACQDPLTRPLAAHAMRGFDTAKSRTTLKLDLDYKNLDEIDAAARAATWDILQMVRETDLVFPHGAVRLSLAIPAVALTDTSADSVNDGMFYQHWSKEVETRVQAILEAAPLSTDTWAMDGAYANEKLYQCHEDDFEIKTTVVGKILCMSHRTYLVEVVAKDVVSKPRIDDIWAVCGSLRTGAYFFRIIASVLPVVRRDVDIVVAVPPAGAIAFNEELKNFAVQNYKIFKRALEHAGDKRAAYSEKFEKNWSKYIGLYQISHRY